MRNDWVIELAKERLQSIEERVNKKYFEEEKHDPSRSVALVHDALKQTEHRENRKEIMKGNYELQMSHKLPFHIKIERFASEPVAFHLYKKRDFIKKLLNIKEITEDEEQEKKFITFLKQILKETEAIERKMS